MQTTPDSLSIPVGDRATTGLAYPAITDRRLGATLVLAHGAGAGQTNGFIVQFAEALAARGLDVLTFNFLYTEQRRKLPDRPELLEACYRAAVDAARSHAPFAGNKVFIGGKSMGGRIASHLAATDAAPDDATAAGIAGLVLLGYPLHPPGKPDQLRVAHLPRIRIPVLILQGERDPFGSPEELRPHFASLGPLITLHAIEGGDHSLAVRAARLPGSPKPRGGEGGKPDRLSAGDHYARLQDVIAAWIANVA